MWVPYQYHGARNAPPLPGQQAQRPEPLDWNLVSVLDPEIIQKVKDFDSLQKIITNFSAANFAAGCSKVLAHPLAIRLCQLLQIGFQFMDFSQKEMQKVIADGAGLKEKLSSRIAKLKKQLLATEEKLKVKSVPYDKCPVCCKKFKSIDFVDKHICLKHSELAESWDCIRGRKLPGKEPELQLVLDEIARLRATIKKKDDSPSAQNDYNVGASHENDSDGMEEQSIMIGKQLSACVDDFNQSMKLWNDQKEEANERFNIFNRPSNFIPPPLTRPILISQEDLQESCENVAIDLFAPEQAKQDSFNIKEAHVDVDDAPINFDEEEELLLPQVFMQEKDKLQKKFPQSDRKVVLQKAQKVLYKPEKSVLETAKKSQITDAIDLVKRKEKSELKKFTNGANGDCITPSYVRQNISFQSTDYKDFKNYIQEQLESNYPIEGSRTAKWGSIPQVMDGQKKNPVEFNLIRTGVLADSDTLNHDLTKSSFVSNLLVEAEENIPDIPSFSYESIEPSQKSNHSQKIDVSFTMNDQKTIISTPENDNHMQFSIRASPTISITEEPLLDEIAKDEKSAKENEYTYEYYSDTENISELPSPPLDMVDDNLPELPVDEQSVTQTVPIPVPKEIDNVLISPIPKKKIVDQNTSFQKSIKDILPCEENNESQDLLQTSHPDLTIATVSQTIKMPEKQKTELSPPKEVVILPPKTPPSSKRDTVIRSDFAISPSPPLSDLDKNNFLQSPPTPKGKRYSPQATMQTDKQSAPSTPPRVVPLTKIKGVEDQYIKPLEVDEFEFEDSPRVDPLKSLSQISVSNYPPRVSLSPSAASPTKRKQKIIISEEIPVEPSSDIDIDSLSDIQFEPKQKLKMKDYSFQNPNAIDSMIEGSFEESGIVQDSIYVDQAENSNIGFSLEESRDDSLISGSPMKQKEGKLKSPKAQKARKLSPRREARHSELSAIESNKTIHSQLSDGEDDGQFNITEELRKLDEDVRKNEIDSLNEIASNLFKKSPVRNQSKPRLSKQMVDDESILLKNRVSIFNERSQSTEQNDTSFSINPNGGKINQPSYDNYSLLASAKHLKKGNKKKQPVTKKP